ncbi:MAG: rhodanese-like domain-containing protein [Planctomycetota bacterium]
MTKQLQTWCLTTITLGALALSVTAAEHTKDSLQTVKQKIADKKAVLVDVREKSEWKNGHVAGAIPLPISELQAGIDAKTLEQKLPKGRIIYTHCVVGKRALTAADILQKSGYEVRALKAGYKELLDAGFEKSKD